MRKIYYLALLLFVYISASSQSQNNMSYQAVIRNSSNNLITNQAVGMRISILQGSAVGTEVYVETQNPISNINGLVTLEIGNGTPTLGTYNGINWANGPYFVKTETDPTGGNSYTVVGVSQLMSVPYALYALNSGSSIAGPMGPQGPAGINGLDGATGPMGPQGPMGLSGVPTAFTFLSKTTNYTITSSDILNNVYLKNTSNSLITITLPSASIAGSGKMIYITSTSTSLYQSINVLSNGVDTIYGFYSNTTGTMNISTMTSSNIGWIQLVSDGTSWNILGMYW
jgi:hypothetical protein